MRDDDERPRRKMTQEIAHEIGCDLSAVSVEELRLRIGLLEGEIARIRDEERRKLASREAAGSFFKRDGEAVPFRGASPPDGSAD